MHARWLLAIGVLAGCTEGSEPWTAFAEDFECGAGLCGWEADQPGVELVEVRPGEHRLHLPGPARVRNHGERSLGLSECDRVQLVSDCAWGSDAGRWRPLETAIEDDTLVIRLPPRDLTVDFERQTASIATWMGVHDVVVEDVGGDCSVDAIRLLSSTCGE